RVAGSTGNVLERIIVGRVPRTRTGHPKLNLLAKLRLPTREYLSSDAVYLHIIDIAGPLNRTGYDAAALGEVLIDRYLAWADPWFQSEKVSKGPFVQHAGRPGRLVINKRRDFGEVGARGIDAGFDEDLVAIGRFDWGEIRKGIAAELEIEPGQSSGKACVKIGGDLIGHEVAAVIGPGEIVS